MILKPTHNAEQKSNKQNKDNNLSVHFDQSIKTTTKIQQQSNRRTKTTTTTIQ
jgi:hypothetical protein